MLLIERVLSFEAERVVCGARPTEACIFAREGAIPGVVLLEYMAQATAAYLALARPHDRGARSRGLLVSARHFALAVPVIACGTELVVSARPTASAGPAAGFECRVDGEESHLARAELTVYLASEST